MRALSRALPVLIACASLCGCATVRSIEDRSWSWLRTEHFDIASAFDEATTRKIAADLERFRVAAEYLWGETLPPSPHPTRVVAYDGYMGEEWAFYLSSADSSYMIESPHGDWVVIRGNDVRNGELPVALKLSLARRLYWNARAQAPPPWYVEGLAQVASTTRLDGEDVEIGVVRSDQLERLRTEHWVPLERVLSTPDLGSWSDRERELFDAESWAVAHYLRSTRAERDSHTGRTDLYLAGLESGAPAGAAGRGLGEALTGDVVRHVQQSEFESLLLRIDSPVVEGAFEPIASWERDFLAGELSLAIEHQPAVPWNFVTGILVMPFWLVAEAFRGPPDPPYREAQARAFLERARSDPGDSPSAMASLAVALARLGEVESAVEICDRAAARGRYEPGAQRRLGDAWLALAHREPEGQARQRPLEQAVAAYETAVGLDSEYPAAWYGLATARLESGDTEGALDALEILHRWLPGDPEVQQLSARAELARGDRAAARLWAGRAITTARNDAEIAAARGLLERIEAQVALTQN